jgi:hypothetical protein
MDRFSAQIDADEVHEAELDASTQSSGGFALWTHYDRHSSDDRMSLLPAAVQRRTDRIERIKRRRIVR